MRETEGLGVGCTLALGALFTAPAVFAIGDVVVVPGGIMDARGRATIEARGAVVPTTLRAGARDIRGAGITDMRGFAAVVEAVEV
jgi:hypothetical protein